MTRLLRDQLQTSLAGRYEIERELGRGGMATVYLARDLRHQRSVALKVLDPELGAVLGAERFLSEIRVTANLQHPNLLPLFDSGEADGLLFYVMPFVDGETLRARLEREKQLPVDDAVRIAVAVAHALDYAHAQGVIHRDLKPENILLRHGQPMVADFGIALAVSNAGGQRVTQTGLSLGTPQYMSPEQATGDRIIDARSDLYSLGAVTYEMLAGEPPHVGATAQAVIARLLTEDARSLALLRRSVPPHVDAAVRRALEKLPADRFATAGELALALQGKGDAVGPRHVPADLAPALRRSRRLGVAGWGTAALLAAGLAVALLRRPEAPASPVIRTRIELGPGERALLGGFPIVLSPHGDRIAYAVTGPSGVQTIVRRTSELSGHVIFAGTPGGLAFSPDGRWLAYAEGDIVRKVPADGGQSVVVGTAPEPVNGMAWSPRGDRLVLGSARGLSTMPAAGGAAHRVAGLDTAAGAVLPVVLPDGETVLYSTAAGPRLGQMTAASLTAGGATELGIRGARALGVVAGRLVYSVIGGPLMAVPFDVRRRRVTGGPLQIEPSALGAGLSASGTLAFGPGQPLGRLVLASGGRLTPLLDAPRRFEAPRFSPDGRRIAVAVLGENTGGLAGEGRSDIWVYDLGARTFTRLTTRGDNGAPEWTPDGARVLFRVTSQRKRTLWWRAADGSAEAEKLYEAAESINEGLVSPDGKWLVYRTGPGPVHSRDIFAVPLAGGGRPTALVTGPAAENMPRLSPDGRWLAYQSDESGRFEIYVRPFPGPGARVQVSNDGGTEPLWARSARTLSYRTASGVVSVDVIAGATFAIGERRTVLTGDFLVETTHPDWDVSPDGRSFLMLQPVEAPTAPVVVHNWARELREQLARQPE